MKADFATMGWKEKMQYQFFAQLLRRCAQRTDLFSNVTPQGYECWVDANAGRTGMTWTLRVPLYKEASTYLCLFKLPPEVIGKRFEILFAHKDEVERSFGEPLLWDFKEDRKQQYIRSLCPIGGLAAKDKWPSIQDDLVDRLIRLERSLRNAIKEIE